MNGSLLELMEIMSHSILKAGSANNAKFFRDKYFLNIEHLLDVPVRQEKEFTEAEKVVLNHNVTGKAQYKFNFLKNRDIAFDRQNHLTDDHIESHLRYENINDFYYVYIIWYLSVTLNNCPKFIIVDKWFFPAVDLETFETVKIYSGQL